LFLFNEYNLGCHLHTIQNFKWENPDPQSFSDTFSFCLFISQALLRTELAALSNCLINIPVPYKISASSLSSINQTGKCEKYATNTLGKLSSSRVGTANCCKFFVNSLLLINTGQKVFG